LAFAWSEDLSLDRISFIKWYYHALAFCTSASRSVIIRSRTTAIDLLALSRREGAAETVGLAGTANVDGGFAASSTPACGEAAGGFAAIKLGAAGLEGRGLPLGLAKENGNDDEGFISATGGVEAFGGADGGRPRPRPAPGFEASAGAG